MSFDIYAFTHGDPCGTDEFEQAEKSLGHMLPPELVRIYKLANGFRGPTNAAFLYPLQEGQSFNQETAVGLTRFFRQDPGHSELWKRAVAFGDFGIGATWGINIDTNQVFEWWPDDGEQIIELGTSIFDVWGKKKEWYDKVV